MDKFQLPNINISTLKRFSPLMLALTGILSAILLVKRVVAPVPELAPPVSPSSNPYPQAIVASGIIESVRDNVPVGAATSGVIEKIFVDVWEPVEEGAPLFRIDTRVVADEVEVDEAKYKVAEAKRDRLLDQFHRLTSIGDPRAVSQDLIKTKEYDVLVAEEELKQAGSELKLKRALLGRLTVRAPRKGVVIQKGIREGEYLSLTPKEPAILLGDLSELQIRADIDEQNACKVQVGSPATAYPKNNPQQKIPLEFVRIEPYVLPKKSLTGSSDERVDTRVLQVIYRFEPPKSYTLYVGQQVDVFIEIKQAEKR